MINKENGRLENKWMSAENPNYSITEIGLNTEKMSEDVKRLAVTQIPVKDHPLTLI